MRPEKVSTWRGRLPPPFDQPRPTITRRSSAARLEGVGDHDNRLAVECRPAQRTRSDSASGAVDQADRSVSWLKFIHASHGKVQQEKKEIAIEKLRRLALRHKINSEV